MILSAFMLNSRSSLSFLLLLVPGLVSLFLAVGLILSWMCFAINTVALQFIVNQVKSMKALNERCAVADSKPCFAYKPPKMI